jgi:peptidase E
MSCSANLFQISTQHTLKEYAMETKIFTIVDTLKQDFQSDATLDTAAVRQLADAELMLVGGGGTDVVFG